MEAYRRYFDIDPDFFPAVNNDVIKKEPDLWKKYYPHETFVKLLIQTLKVIERQQKLNIWVEGAYGTGKSHAVLTLKRLLDASEEETNEYFTYFKLNDDLRKKFNSAKSQGRIITVHRYGSSSIQSDNDLFLAMQESIEASLKDAGITNAGPNALKDGIIKYLSDEENKQSFSIYVNGSYRDVFGGETVDDIIKHLGEYQDQALQALMNKIFKVANEKNIKAFTLDDSMMVQWITEVIKANKLKAIIFIWDEFTEYFSNNTHRLTGFQHILDMSQHEPFCFIPVTHKSDAGMDDADTDKKKILDRFVRPTCIIELPDNMAFKLMGAAMRKNEDAMVRKEWEQDILPDLEERTHDSRKRIMEKMGITDHELRGILPIHPYAACVLKHISASFASNQRSMFDFIKNAGNDDLKGFQWYMDNYGPFDESPFLTIDLLWAFFYDNGKNDLSINIRHILDRYAGLSKYLNNDEQSVLKTVLLLQAISQSTGDAVEIFLPNEKNINYAFEGSHLDSGQAVRCAEKLVNDKVLYKRNLSDGKILYSVLTGEMDAAQIDKEKAQFEARTTTNLISDGSINEALELDHDLSLRFKLSFAGATDIDSKAKQAIREASEDLRHFQVVVGFARDASEAAIISKKIKDYMARETDVIFIDCGRTPLTLEKFEKWVENMAISAYNTGKNASTANQYNTYAKAILTEWRGRIKSGQFVLYSSLHNGENMNSLEALNAALRDIDRKRFNLALECHYRSISNWWIANSLAVGVECGATRTLKGTYNNNNANLKQQLAIAWDTERYWTEHPSEPISRIKSDLTNFIEEKLKKNGRISILEIYNKLNEAPYGFLPCNMTAFFLGFLLKEYADDSYSWSDEISSDSMSLQKLKEMVAEVINLDNTYNPRYRNKYIVTMTPEEKAFGEGTSIAFDIPKENCSSVENSRDRIRGKMKGYSFPTWTLSYILNGLHLQTPIAVIESLLSDYQDLVNNQTNISDAEIAYGIGKLFLANRKASADLHSILTEDKCKEGMLKYLSEYKEGLLPTLAKQIDDHGQFINELRRKIDASEANWLWKRQTVDLQIDAVILEYQIVQETNKLIGYCNSFTGAVSAWNEKVGNIKVSFETVKNYVSDIQPLLAMLKEIKQQGTLVDSKKEQFLQCLKGYGDQFNKFYTNQLDLFIKACDFYLQDLNTSDKEKVFKRISGGNFTTDKATYVGIVESTVAAFRKELDSIRLKSLWKEKTGTESPHKWSSKYQMPILAMIPNEDLDECRRIFDIVNSGNPTDNDINKALVLLEKFKYWDLLADASERDKVFREKILGERSVMLTDVQEVKDYLTSHVTEAPYHWMGSPQIATILKSLAESKYVSQGYKVAMERIDSMNPEEVKKYLKDLIKNNMSVGIQIIMNN